MPLAPPRQATGSHHGKKADRSLTLSAGNHVVAKLIGTFQGQAKDRDEQAGRAPRDGGQQTQHQQTAMAFCRIVGRIQRITPAHPVQTDRAA